MKLFEIPVYALTRERLKEQVDSFVEEEKKKYSIRHGERPSEDHMNELIVREISPQCAWDYNHIVGFVAIVFSGNDIVIEWFSPYYKYRKYYWRTKDKVFLRNDQLVGFHFSILVGMIKFEPLRSLTECRKLLNV